MTTDQEQTSLDFVRQIVADDIATNKNDGNIVTRFPPEPNGYLHIGHAKSICLNFGIAAENGGVCHLRFDDTNPCKEEDEFVQEIKKDIRWLGFDWGEHEYYASDYYQHRVPWKQTTWPEHRDARTNPAGVVPRLEGLRRCLRPP